MFVNRPKHDKAFSEANRRVWEATVKRAVEAYESGIEHDALKERFREDVIIEARSRYSREKREQNLFTMEDAISLSDSTMNHKHQFSFKNKAARK